MDPAAVDAALTRLVARGAIDEAQAAEVRAELALAAPHRRGTAGAEVAAWVGAVLAASAGITAAARFWAELTVWAQSALLALVAVALLAAGRSVLGDGRPVARRVVGLTWALGTLAAGAAVHVPAEQWLDARESAPMLAAAAAAVLLGLLLWRVHPGPLQLVALAAAWLVAVLAALGLAERPPFDLFGLVVWAHGVALVLLSWGGLAQPRRTGLVLGAVAALVGAEVLHFAYPRSGVLLGLATVAAVLWLGGLLDLVALTGLAAAALALFAPQALEAFFPGSLNASAALFLAGVLLLAGALVTIRAARGGASEEGVDAGST